MLLATSVTRTRKLALLRSLSDQVCPQLSAELPSVYVVLLLPMVADLAVVQLAPLFHERSTQTILVAAPLDAHEFNLISIPSIVGVGLAGTERPKLENL